MSHQLQKQPFIGSSNAAHSPYIHSLYTNEMKPIHAYYIPTDIRYIDRIYRTRVTTTTMMILLCILYCIHNAHVGLICYLFITRAIVVYTTHDVTLYESVLMCVCVCLCEFGTVRYWFSRPCLWQYLRECVYSSNLATGFPMCFHSQFGVISFSLCFHCLAVWLMSRYLFTSLINEFFLSVLLMMEHLVADSTGLFSMFLACVYTFSLSCLLLFVGWR